jgi:hypothetical protein
MKTVIKTSLTLAACTLAFTPALFAQLAIPSDGSDGALVVTTNTLIDLSQAVTGHWDDNNAAHAGSGVYDPSKWAVVFKYSSVDIASGATVTFTNHPSHAPVVWLVSGDVTNNGAISLDGQSVAIDWITQAEPGPGGFRGGTRGMMGFGPGGGYSTVGYYATGNSYGNDQIVPLIGGSGAGGGPWSSAGGGGAILIAASGTMAINGVVRANGAQGPNYGDGAGGGIRLIAGQLLGSGVISATANSGNPGRIRLEATNAPGLNLHLNPGPANPLTMLVSPLPLTIWPATNAPTVQVMTISNSVANLTAPTDPKAVVAGLDGAEDDLAIATTAAATIGLQTANFPTNGTVNVYIKSIFGGQTVLPASFGSGDSNLAHWQLVTPFPWPLGHTVIQARAVLP